MSSITELPPSPSDAGQPGRVVLPGMPVVLIRGAGRLLASRCLRCADCTFRLMRAALEAFEGHLDCCCTDPQHFQHP